MRPLLLLAALSIGAVGCQNSCQKLCADMAKFAEDCGFDDWEKEDIAQCRDDFAGKNLDNPKNERDYCSTVGDALDEEWECDDLAVYFDNPAAGAGGGSDTGS